jgi:hypothetical protein
VFMDTLVSERIYAGLSIIFGGFLAALHITALPSVHISPR